MLRKELVIGFVVAGFLAALVPTGFWQSLFLTGHGFWSSLENVVLGPFLAIISFVCSVGNVPLAAALWQGGISFGGVVSFVFADLITLPLLSIYRKYYGTAITLRHPRRVLGRHEHRRPGRGVPVPGGADPEPGPAADDRAHRVSAGTTPASSTSWRWSRSPSSTGSTATATPAAPQPLRQGPGLRDAGRDRTRPGHRASVDGVQYWFCSDHCEDRFTASDTAAAIDGTHGTTASEHPASHGARP